MFPISWKLIFINTTQELPAESSQHSEGVSLRIIQVLKKQSSNCHKNIPKGSKSNSEHAYIAGFSIRYIKWLIQHKHLEKLW